MPKWMNSFVNALPLVGSWVGRVRRRLRPAVPQRSAEEIFTSIFQRRAWGNSVSVSGPGSDAAQTERLVANLRSLMEEHGLRQRDLLDVFGSRGIASEVVSGKRAVSKAQAKKLAEIFHVPADLFL